MRMWNMITTGIGAVLLAAGASVLPAADEPEASANLPRRDSVVRVPEGRVERRVEWPRPRFHYRPHSFYGPYYRPYYPPPYAYNHWMWNFGGNYAGSYHGYPEDALGFPF